MSELVRQQQSFAGLMRDATAAADGFDHSPLDITTGLAMYRNNLKVAWRNALKTTFPVLTQLLGNDGMALLSRDYLRMHPSQSGDLNNLGIHLPSFLKGYEPLQMYPYLCDVATLEWHVHQAHDAADHTPLKIMDLMVHGTDDWLAAHVEFAPSASLISTGTAAASIWLAHQDGGDLSVLQNDAVIMRPEYVLSSRPLWQVEIRILDVGLYAFLIQLQQNQTFEQAFEYMDHQGLEFDFIRALPILLESGVWAHITF